MRVFFLFILLITVTFTTLRAQASLPAPLSHVLIVGNDQTDKDIIERELLVLPGEILTDSLLHESKNRLENLLLFNRVEMFALDNGDSVSLLISVTERLFLFPYPVFQVDDRDWNKLTYGLGLAFDNFRGRNEKLYFSAVFGHRPGYMLSYYNPWIGRDWHLTGGFFIQKYIVTNRILPIDERHLYLALTIGKYWTHNWSTRFILSYDDIQLKGRDAANLVQYPLQQTNTGLSFISIYDSRDLHAYPSRGLYTQILFRKQGLNARILDYSKLLLDVRAYLPLGKWIAASRFFTEQSYGNLPVYDRTYLGFEERIRGHFSEIREGNHTMIYGLGLRIPVFPVHYYNTFSSLLPTGGRNLKFGMNVGLFAESGIIWNTKKEFKSNRFISGFGFGLHFLLPYIEVLRADMAFNEKLKHEFIVEIEMPF